MSCNLEDFVHRRGWHVDVNSVAGECLSTSTMSADDLEDILLNYDLRKCGRPSLPADINGAVVGSLNGPLVLQVMGFQDVSVPSKFNAGSSYGGSKNRIMMFRLTDGVKECKAIECKPLESLKPKELLPGMKIRLEGKVTIRYGLVLLTDACFIVLGGRVSSLAEAYEAKQLYGGVERAGQVSKSEGQPPRFKPFDPTRRIRKKDIKTRTRESASGNMDEKEVESNPMGNKDKASNIQKKPVGSSSKIAASLLERMEENSNTQKFGRHGRGRRGRRHHDDDESSSKHMTLDEWEASKNTAKSSVDTDYELAMELQQKFDVEDCVQSIPSQAAVIQPSFFYEESGGGHRRGRGRSRGRGRGRGVKNASKGRRGRQ